MNAKSEPSSALIQRLAAELVIIVAGVLIALAIDEFWGNLEEANLADVYVHQLIADLHTTEDAFVKSAPRAAAADEAARALLALFNENQQADLQRVHELLTRTGDYDNAVPVLGTIEALISTGDLRLIRDPDVRVNITGYLSYVRDYWLIPLYDFEDRHQQMYSRMQILAAEYGISPRGTDRLSRDPENADVAGFIANNEAYALLTDIVQVKDLFNRYSEAITRRASELRLLLDQSTQTD